MSTTMIYCSLFGIGKLIFKEYTIATLCLAGAVVTGAAVYYHTSKLNNDPARESVRADEVSGPGERAAERGSGS